VTNEWPDLLAARYHAFNLQFDRTMRQSPDWRAFKQNADSADLSTQQAGEVGSMVRTSVSALRQNEAAEFVDPLIPQSLDMLSKGLHPAGAGEPNFSTERAVHELGVDLLEGVNNVLKRIFEVALQAVGPGSVIGSYGRALRESLHTAAAQAGEADGARIVRWIHRVFWGLVVPGGFTTLVANYPFFFGWLGPISTFLHNHFQ